MPNSSSNNSNSNSGSSDGASILTLLVEFGLTPTEAIVYSSVVALGGGTTKQISLASGKERAQTHHALLKLQQLGIVEATGQVPTQFKPVGIREAVNHLYSMQSMKLQKLKELRRNLIEELGVARTEGTSVAETYSIIKGRVNTYLRMIESIQAASSEVSLIMSAKGLTRLKRFRNFYSTMQSKYRKGVRFQIISEINPNNLQDAKLVAALSDFRHVRNQITNASIYDEKIGSVALSISEDLAIDAGDHVALWTTARSFISTLRNFYNSVWFVAAPAQSTIKTIESDL